MKKIYTWRIHDGYARYWTKEAVELFDKKDNSIQDEDAYWKKDDIAIKYLAQDFNPNDLDKWDPPMIIEEPDDDGRLRIKGDFHSAWSYESYIVSQNMVDKIGDVLREYGQLFPLEVEDREDKLYRYWVTKEVPFKCVDKQKSKFFNNKYSEDDVFIIERLILKEDCLNIPMIFRIKGELEKNIFVTEDFIKLVKKNDLKGFKFEIDTSYEYANNYGPYILVG